MPELLEDRPVAVVVAERRERDAGQRYYVDYWDMSDWWGRWGAQPARLFDSLDEARACRDRLNDALVDDNPDAITCGEHYGVIDRTVHAEIECVLQRLRARR